MKGFQMTFNLYNNHTSEINDDDMDFGGVEQGGDRHDDGCSSGNGANADAIIVTLCNDVCGRNDMKPLMLGSGGVHL